MMVWCGEGSRTSPHHHPVSRYGSTVSVVVRLTERTVAVIVTGVEDPTAIWVTVNVAVVSPSRTVTLTGTVAADVSLLMSVTTMPPAGAAIGSVTVPVTVLPSPPVTLVGLTETLVIGV